MWQFLQGKKTYLVAAAGVAWAWTGVYLGHMDAATAQHMTETALLGMTIRHGISTTLGN